MRNNKPRNGNLVVIEWERMQRWIRRLDSRYGICRISEPLSEYTMELWEAEHRMRIPEDYKAWLRLTGSSEFTGVPMEFYPPSRFKKIANQVAIGRRNGKLIFFSPDHEFYFSEIGTEIENLGKFSTILRVWRAEVKKLFFEEDLELLRPVIEKETEKMQQKKVIAEQPGAGIPEWLAFFFARNNVASLKKHLCFPRHSLPDSLKNSPLLISDADEDGYYQWQPLLQTEAIPFDAIEAKLGFSIRPEIKALVSTHYYYLFNVKFQKFSLALEAIVPKAGWMQPDRKQQILKRFDFSDYDNGYDFTGGHPVFRIGYGFIGEQDFCCVMDNETGVVYAVNYLEKRHEKIADSLLELIQGMKPVDEEETV